MESQKYCLLSHLIIYEYQNYYKCSLLPTMKAQSQIRTKQKYITFMSIYLYWLILGKTVGHDMAQYAAEPEQHFDAVKILLKFTNKTLLKYT